MTTGGGAGPTSPGRVLAVAASPFHEFSKQTRPVIRLIEGLGHMIAAGRAQGLFDPAIDGRSFLFLTSFLTMGLRSPEVIGGGSDEDLLDVREGHLAARLHQDLPHRLAHLKLPVSRAAHEPGAHPV